MGVGMKRCCTMFSCIDDALNKAMSCHGGWVARYPWICILIPMLIGSVSLFSLWHLNHGTDVFYLFTPTDSKYYYERSVVEEHWPNLDGNYLPNKAVTIERQCQLIVSLHNESENILETQYHDAITELNNLIMTQIYIFKNGKRYTYQELCFRAFDGLCWDNRLLWYVGQTYANEPQLVTYPKLKLGVKELYLGSTLGGVKLNEINGNLTNIVHSAKAWYLIYHLRYDDTNLEDIDLLAGMWEREFEKVFETLKHPALNLQYFHSRTLIDEMGRNAETCIGRFSIAFLTLGIFTWVSNLKFIYNKQLSPFPFVDWCRTKSMLGIMACINAGLGSLTAIGLLTVLGKGWNPIIAIMPYLAVGVGVDNMYLLVNAWHKTSMNDEVETRMRQTFSEAAVSITITALTDSVSFAIATITTIPAVNEFCAFASLAIAFTFVFQLTFFTGWLAIYGRIEAAGRNHLFFCKVIPKEDAAQTKWYNLFTNMGSVSDHNKHSSHRPKIQLQNYSETFFRDWYGTVLTHPAVKLLVVVWYGLYVAIATWGCMNVRQGLDPVHLLPTDSYAVDFYHQIEKTFWPYGQELQVVINNPPDFTEYSGWNETWNIVNSFVGTNYSMNSNGLSFFFDEFEVYLRTTQTWIYLVTYYNENITKREMTGKLRSFFDLMGPRWRADLDYEEYEVDGYMYAKINAIRFMIGMHNDGTQYDQMLMCQYFRGIADSMPQYNITTVWAFWGFMDQYALVVPNTLQNILITLIVMLVISVLLIPQLVCAIFVALSVLSISVGVIGLMSMWQVDFDAIAMITMTMTVGFSVDFAAHISHAYVSSKIEDPDERVHEALGSLAWPIIQGGLSTIIGVAVLSTVESYSVQTFFKMIFLVITIGMAHALLFLPVFLSILAGIGKFCCRRRKVLDVSVTPRNAKKMTYVREQPTNMYLPYSDTAKHQESLMRAYHRTPTELG